MNVRRVVVIAQAAVREARDLSVASVAWAVFAVTFLIPERVLVRAGGYMARQVGKRLTRQTRIGMRNLALAFPEKTIEERRDILRRSWDNMGRTAVEYFYIDRIWDFDPATPTAGRIEIDGIAQFAKLASDDRAAIIVSAHLGNWELPMVAAARHGLHAAALFTRPKNRWIARILTGRRRSIMGEMVMSGPGAMHRLANTLKAGGHLGLLVDQFYHKGPKITLFGHRTEANPIFARLARQLECPVHMVRVVRLAGDRFRIELGEELDLPRDASGRIDIVGALQKVGTVIEGWVREYPDQWLWVHRRWR